MVFVFFSKVKKRIGGYNLSKIYIGEKYAPSLEGDWDIAKSYERLSIVMYDNKGYISRVDVPKGTNILDTSYWMFIFGTGGSSGSIDWADIVDKPTTFPPAYHTQDWDTILNPPLDYPPSPHTHDVQDVITLTGELNKIKSDILALQSAGTRGTESATRFSQLTSLGDVVPTTVTIPWDGTSTTNGTVGAYFYNDNGYFYIVDPNSSTQQYDVYCSAMFTINSIGSDTSYEREFTVKNFTTQNVARYRLVPGNASPPYVCIIPQFYVGFAIPNPAFRMSASIKLYSNDNCGGNIQDSYFMLRAVKK